MSGNVGEQNIDDRRQSWLDRYNQAYLEGSERIAGEFQEPEVDIDPRLAALTDLDLIHGTSLVEQEHAERAAVERISDARQQLLEIFSADKPEVPASEETIETTFAAMQQSAREFAEVARSQQAEFDIMSDIVDRPVENRGFWDTLTKHGTEVVRVDRPYWQVRTDEDYSGRIMKREIDLPGYRGMRERLKYEDGIGIDAVTGSLVKVTKTIHAGRRRSAMDLFARDNYHYDNDSLEAAPEDIFADNVTPTELEAIQGQWQEDLKAAAAKYRRKTPIRPEDYSLDPQETHILSK